MTQTNSELKNDSRSTWRPRKSAWILAFLIVVPPWILVSGPGVLNSSGDTSVFGTNLRLLDHGWPMVHARTIYANDTYTCSFGPPQIPDATDLQTMAAVALASKQGSQQQEPLFNWRLLPAPYVYGADEEEGFWSDPENWQLFSQANGIASDWKPLRLLGNLVILGLLTLCVAGLVEWRQQRCEIQKRRFLQVSTFETLSILTVITFIFAFVNMEYRRAAKEKQLLDTIRNSSACYMNPFNDKISMNQLVPQLLSNLLDNRACLPATEVVLFRQVSKLPVVLSFNGLDSPELIETENDLADAFDQANFEIDLRATLSKQTISFLNRIKAENIVLLDLDLSEIDELSRRGHNQSIARKSLNQIGLPNLEQLKARLNPNTNQGPQIEYVLKTPTAGNPEIVLRQVNLSGADYLIDNINHLPGNLKFHVCAKDAKQLKSKLRPFEDRIQLNGIAINNVFEYTTEFLDKAGRPPDQ